MSVAELVVASIIGLLVLGAAYLLFETGMKGYRQVENQTISGRTAAQSLQRMERPLREASGISIADSYELEFLSDPNDDDALEFIRFWIPAGSTRLMMERAKSDHTATSTAVVVADGIRNRTTGVPLFTYFREAGVPITNPLQAGETTGSAARIVRLVVVTQPTTTQTPAPPSYRVQTDIFLRNRSQ